MDKAMKGKIDTTNHKLKELNSQQLWQYLKRFRAVIMMLSYDSC